MDKVSKDNGNEKSCEINCSKMAASCCNGDQKSSGKNEDLSQIDNIIGNFGKYQFLIFMFKILIGITSAFNNLGVTFFAPVDFVGFWCADNIETANLTMSPNSQPSLGFLGANGLPYDPHYHNHTANQMNHPSSRYLPKILNEFMFNNERSYRHTLNLNSDTPKNLRKECGYTTKSDNKYHKCKSFKYDTGIWISTIIDEWNLVCDRAWLVSLTQSLYMAGFIISYLVFGYFSDRFGRWKSLMLGALIEILSGFGCALSGSVTSFMFFRFLLGLGNAGRSSSSYLIMIEWCGPKWRMHISTLGSLGWVIGYCSMPWITLYYLHFRHMQLFVCFYEVIFVIWLLRIPESPRWLLTHKRFDEAYEVLLMAAKFNGLIKDSPQSDCIGYDSSDTTMSPLDIISSSTTTTTAATAAPINTDPKLMGNLNRVNKLTIKNDLESTSNKSHPLTNDIKPYSIKEFNIKFKHLSSTISAKEFTKNEDKLNILDLFKWKNLRKYTIILAFAWALNSFIYYGIALRVGDFGGTNLFIAFSIAGITELPSIAFTIVCMKFLPRKTTNIFIFTAVGLLCALQMPLKYYNCQWLQQSTIMLAKFFNSCSFTCILYQTMELFPTSIRQTAYSSCSLAGRVGSILAPFIKELSQWTNPSVPPFIYAALSFLSIVFIGELPETKGSDLPDTLLEAEKFKGTDIFNPNGSIQTTSIVLSRESSGNTLTRRIHRSSVSNDT